MSQYYSVTLKLIVNDGDGFVAAANEKFQDGKHDYAINKWKERENIKPDTVNNIIRIMLKGFEVNFYHVTLDENSFVVHIANFKENDDWAEAMSEFFETICPYICNGSCINIFPDEGTISITCENGEAKYN